MAIDQTVADFDQMQHHADVRSELIRLIQTNKIPNALLFTGPAGSGRKEAAFWFAKGCNCLDTDQSSVCGHCKSCLKIDAKSNPDILEAGVESGKKIITISQIRQLGLALSNRANEAKYRMVLIEDSHQMNVQAQNALLKILEEPPEKTFFILIADKPSVLLPTIISRCRQIRFRQMTCHQIESLLSEEYQADPVLAKIVSKTADNDIKKALVYLNIDSKDASCDWIKKRKWLLSSLCRLTHPQAGIAQCVQTGLMISRTLTLEKDFIDDHIAMMKTFFRDLLVFGYHPKKIVNLDFFDDFEDINGKLSRQIVFKWLAQLFETERKIAQNCSLRLALDSFFLQIVRTRDE